MKKLMLSAAIAVAVMNANAQTKSKTTPVNKIGLHAGTTFSNYKVKTNNAENTSDFKFGATVGAIADIDFGNSVSFRPELNFIQKGGELKYMPLANVNVQEELTLNYIQLSPNFVYNFGAGTGNFFIGAGPELSFGLGGKRKVETKSGTTTVNSKTDVKFDSDNSSNGVLHLKTVDYGANALLGYKFNNGVQLTTGYTIGLNNLSNDNGSDFKTRGFNIKLGYLFNK